MVFGGKNGCLAQLVERRPYKADVGGSNPSAPTNSRVLRSGSSVWLEYLPVTQGVAGSSPVHSAI